MANSALGSQSIALLQLPSGMLIDFAGTVEPVGWLMCDGRAVSRTTFSSLFASIGTAYGVGDGSTTFNLPDFRGRFARYNDNMGTAQGAASRDTGRAHGSSQGDAMQGHYHQMAQAGNNFFNNFAGNSNAGSSFGTLAVGGGTAYTNIDIAHPRSDGTNGTPRTAAETRPINLACNKLIKI